MLWLCLLSRRGRQHELNTRIASEALQCFVSGEEYQRFIVEHKDAIAWIFRHKHALAAGLYSFRCLNSALELHHCTKHPHLTFGYRPLLED